MGQTNIYEQLSAERKALQAAGEVPMWWSTGSWQMFKKKYQHQGQTVRQTHERIATTLKRHLPKHMQREAGEWFFKLLWEGWLSASTPVLSNTGTNRGLPVSCSGGFVPDSVHGFYQSRLETAVLTKYGFGTSGYLGSIRPRGSAVSGGGEASGPVPVFGMFYQDMRDISQGAQRRGAWAGYIEIDHDCFDELVASVYHDPDDANVGWIVSDDYIDRLAGGCPEALRRFQVALKLKMTLGVGYFFFIDKANGARPESYVKNNLDIKASNLCSEIMLHSSEDYTFTCVLSSMNLAKWDEWSGTDAVYWATIFLDCVAEEFLSKAEHIKGLEKAVEFTKRGRALGLGVCGFHTYLQQNMLPFGSLQASYFNQRAFKHIAEESLRASKALAAELGEPEWCKGTGLRNTHRLAIAPTKTTALLMGGVSEGINPDPAMCYNQLTVAGEIPRVNPTLLTIMKNRGVYTVENMKDIDDNNGSVQHVTWLTDEEKAVFLTAFEINQEVVLRLASQRQKYICQGQSLNLFFADDEDPAWIGHIHKLAFEDPNILSLYYIYTKAGVSASKECAACQ